MPPLPPHPTTSQPDHVLLPRGRDECQARPHTVGDKRDERTRAQNADSARARQADRNAATCNRKQGCPVSTFLLNGRRRREKKKINVSLFSPASCMMRETSDTPAAAPASACIICVCLHTWCEVNAGGAFRCI